MPIEVYDRNMKVDISNWWRDWRKKQEMCLDCLKSIDAVGVGNISAMIKALRGDGDQAPHIVLAENV